MKRRILAMWAWLTGWFRAPYTDPAGYDFGPESEPSSYDVGDIVLQGDDERYQCTAKGVGRDVEVMTAYPARAATYPALPLGFPVAGSSFKPSDDEVEATRRMNERSANMHKQPCRVVVDARVADLEKQLADARASRIVALCDLDNAQRARDVYRVGDEHVRAALKYVFPRGTHVRTEVLVERVVAELSKLRQTKRTARRAKAARTKRTR